MRVVGAVVFALGIIGLAACAGIIHETAEPGTLTGHLVVMWVKHDKFVYASYEDDPLVFTPSSDIQKKLGIKSIKPGLMYTDAGSMPRPGYAPAYIVRDWLFAAHRCIAHGEPDMDEPIDRPEYDKVRSVSFEDSAMLIAEVIKTLMRDKRVEETPLAFDSVVADPIVARNLWNSTEPKPCEKVSAGDRKIVKDAFQNIGMTERNLFAYSQSKGQQKPPLIVFQQKYKRLAGL